MILHRKNLSWSDPDVRSNIAAAIVDSMATSDMCLREIDVCAVRYDLILIGASEF